MRSFSLKQLLETTAGVVLYMRRGLPAVTDAEILAFLFRRQRRFGNRTPICMLQDPEGKLRLLRVVQRMEAREFRRKK